jgi:hypothetical protein
LRVKEIIEKKSFFELEEVYFFLTA